MSMTILFVVSLGALFILVMGCGVLPSWFARLRWEQDFQTRVMREVGLQIDRHAAHAMLISQHGLVTQPVTGYGTLCYDRTANKFYLLTTTDDGNKTVG